MRFETRIFVPYALLLLVLVCALGVGLRHFMIEQNEERIVATMRATAEKSAHQLEDVILPMEFMTDYLLSDMDVLSAMQTMATVKTDTPRGIVYREGARPVIREALQTSCVLDNFYRISYFDDNGDLITSGFRIPASDPSSLEYSTIPWFETAKEERGRPVVGGAYRDPWARKEDAVMVFGLGRAMPKIGYLEVQQKVSDLDAVFSLDTIPGLCVIAFDSRGTVLYSDVPKEQRVLFRDVSKTFSYTSPTVLDASVFPDHLVVGYGTPKMGVSFFLSVPRSLVGASLSVMDGTVLTVILLILAASFVYSFLVARKVSLPIRRLRSQIEDTGLHNLSRPIPIDTSNNEIEAVSNAYARLLQRLDDEIANKKNLSLLHMKAQLDSLQAQVNPHFLNNVLNVISFRGLKDKDDEICEICDNLAALLQYNTDTKHHLVTMEEELAFLTNYTYLVKTRYREKLHIEIDIADAMKNQRVPRFLIQPFVENAVSHGYAHCAGRMFIAVRGWTQHSWWYVSIVDQGEGFSDERSACLKQALADVRQKLFVRHEHVELDGGGGIGIVNTYARMLLTYGPEHCSLSIANGAEGGAAIVVGAQMDFAGGHEDEA